MAPRRPRPSGSTPRSTDPLAPSASDVVFGGNAMRAPSNVIERGVILSLDAQRQIYRVVLNSGRIREMPRIRNHPGDVTVLPNGAFVIVTFALGNPYILGVLPPETVSTFDENPTSVTDVNGYGGNDPIFNRGIGATSRGRNEPKDVAPGDFIGTSTDGASVSALHGQVAQIRGSALAKVQAFGDSDLVQIVAGVLRTVTWMGESNVVNNEGKTSFIWRGGTDQLTQTGPDEQRYTIKLDVGHTGNMVRFEICNRDNQNVFSVHIDPQGAVEVFSAGGISQHSGASVSQIHPVNFNGSVEETVTGSASRHVAGDVTETHEGSRTESVSSNHSVAVGQDLALSVSRNSRTSVGGDTTVITTGKSRHASVDESRIEVLGPGKSHTVQTTGGSVATQTRTGAYSVTTLGGGITLDASPGIARINASQVVIAAAGGSIGLSAPAAQISIGEGAASGATKWEELNAQIQAMAAQISVLNGLVAAHVHAAIGPLGVSPTLAPLASPITVDLTSARSAVRVG